MKRTWFLMSLLSAGLSAWTIVGCSNKLTTNSDLVPLDTTSAAFMADNVGQPAMDIAGGDAINTLDLVNLIPAPGSPRQPLSPASLGSGSKVWDTVIYSYAGGWHVFNYAFSRVDTQFRRDTHQVISNWQITGYDSVRIWSAGAPVQYRGAADSLESHGHAWGTFSNSDADTGSAARHRVLRIAGNPWANPVTSLTFNGSSQDTLDATFHPRALVTCTLNNAYAGLMTNVVVDSATLYGDGCPPTGSMSFSAHVVLGCTGPADTLNVNGTWSVSVTFDHGLVTKSFSNGLAQAVKTDTCGVGPMASPFRISR